uniref:Uncharacterized protein n=1 Tax=Setaria italica TaxID=4555 RepID=K3YWF7_SETIT
MRLKTLCLRLIRCRSQITANPLHRNSTRARTRLVGQPQRAASRVRGGSRRPGQRRVRVAVVLGDRRVRGLRGRGPSGMRQSWEAALWAALMPARSCSRTCSQRGSREKAEHGGGRGACTGTAAAFAPVAPPPPHRPTMLSRVRRRAEAP